MSLTCSTWMLMHSSYTCLRVASASCARLASPTPRSCSRCPRAFSSFSPRRQSSKRQMQTATAYQPSSLYTEPAPPRNVGAPDSSVAGAAPETTRPSSPRPTQTQTTTAPTQEQPNTTSPSPSTQPTKPLRPRRFAFGPRKATIKITPSAVSHLRSLLALPEPKLIRIGTKAKGCSGLAYHLEYVDKPSALDEQVEQDGVKVLIDNKALLNIIGSEMDWAEDRLSARFVFRNPNITEQCGCGESFSVS